MSINFTRIEPIEVHSPSGKVVYATHAIEAENHTELYLLTDYEKENFELYVARMDSDNVLKDVDPELASAIAESISHITIPDFPTFEEIKEALSYDRPIQ